MPQLLQWDYLIVTASNDRQAAAYRGRLELEREHGMLSNFGRTLVVADPEGKRIGSGGSTILCLLEVLNCELAGGGRANDPQAWRDALSRLRVLIVHAGGDSKRVPAYSPSGKILIPMPGETGAPIAPTLLDRQLPTFGALPPMPAGAGQVVVTCGDALLIFDPGEMRLAPEGVTFVGSLADPAAAGKHGVYCRDAERNLTLYLQKPSIEEQREQGAIDERGQSILDIGVMNFDAATSVTMLRCLETAADAEGRLRWADGPHRLVLERGFDLYSEICAAFGTQTTLEHYRRVCRAVGSKWSDADLERFYNRFRDIAAEVQVLDRVEFLHFGTTRQLITSGATLAQLDRGITPAPNRLLLNTRVSGEGEVVGEAYWVEGCEIRARLELEGQNVVTGARIDSPLRLPKGACLSVVPGQTRAGEPCRFVLCYGIDDQFKDALEQGATFCNRPILEWLESVGARPDDLWENTRKSTLWDARVFPATKAPSSYAQWLWMFDPASAEPDQKQQWLEAERYSMSEIVWLADRREWL